MPAAVGPHHDDVTVRLVGVPEDLRRRVALDHVALDVDAPHVVGLQFVQRQLAFLPEHLREALPGVTDRQRREPAGVDDVEPLDRGAVGFRQRDGVFDDVLHLLGAVGREQYPVVHALV